MPKNDVLTARFIESFHRMKYSKIKKCLNGEFDSRDVSLLLFIYHQCINTPNGITVSYISDSVGVTRSSVTQQTNRLLQIGYITKQSDAADHRSVRVALTNKGLDFIKEMQNKRDNYISELINYLGEDDSNEFIRICDRVTKFVNQQKNVEAPND